MISEKGNRLRSLQTFEAVSRLLSVSRAADELGVTQSAVSHQLRNLAEQIGEPLYSKEGRRIVLTGAGRRLGATLQSAFADIHRSLVDTIGSNRKTVRLAVCSSFAPGWLLKRLTGFYEANPGVDLQVHMYAQDPDLTDQVADAFVSTLPPPAGFWSMLLQTEFLIPVMATARDPFVPGKIPLITTELSPERSGDEWRTYCAEAGLDYDDLHRGHLFQVSHYILALDVVAMEVVRPRLGWEVVVVRHTTRLQEPRMDIHENARTTPRSRMLMIERLEAGWTVAAVASAQGVDGRTVRKWRDRFRAEGAAGLEDRSSRPHSSPSRLDRAVEAGIEALRRRRLSGPAIARQLGRPVSTVGKVLRRIGLGRLKALDPAVPVVRYERERPGELIHLDTKKLGRIDGVGHRITGDRTRQSNRRARGEGLGWEALHVAIDDASRLAYTEILPDEKKTSATAFLERALVFFERHGVNVERVMTDNGAAYKSHLFRQALADRGIRHKRTRPYTPRTNGKAERFIQTSLREWIYATPFETSSRRTAAMPAWLCDYNTRRPHAALGGKPPISKLADNVRDNDS